MTTILIPTDFSATSVKMAEQAIQHLNTEVNVIFFHAYEMPFYYTDLFRAERPPYYNMINDAFRQACKQLKQQHSRLVSKVSFQYLEGNTTAIFKNFAAAHHIDLIICPQSFIYKKTHARSIDPLPLFRKSRIPMLQEFASVQQPTKDIIRLRLQPDLATA